MTFGGAAMPGPRPSAQVVGVGNHDHLAGIAVAEPQLFGPAHARGHSSAGVVA